MKTLLLAIALIGSAMTAVSSAETTPTGPLSYQLTDIDGKAYPLSQHLGKVVLLVNVASKCGLTPQYTALEALYKAKQEQGLVIIGIPANNFMGQEPGTEAEIKQFCSTKYQITFPLMSKVSVKGDDMCPLYKWLTTESAHPGEVEWNFGKFLVGRDGALIGRFHPKVTPDAADLVAAIDAALAAK